MNKHRRRADDQEHTGTKPRSRRRYERQVAGIEKHLENHPNDAAARQRLSNAKDKLRAL